MTTQTKAVWDPQILKPDTFVSRQLFSPISPVQVMAQQARTGRRYLRAFVSGFFIAVPVSLTIFDRVACVARVEGASMQVSCDKENVKSLRWS